MNRALTFVNDLYLRTPTILSHTTHICTRNPGNTLYTPQQTRNQSQLKVTPMMAHPKPPRPVYRLPSLLPTNTKLWFVEVAFSRFQSCGDTLGPRTGLL